MCGWIRVLSLTGIPQNDGRCISENSKGFREYLLRIHSVTLCKRPIKVVFFCRKILIDVLSYLFSYIQLLTVVWTDDGVMLCSLMGHQWSKAVLRCAAMLARWCCVVCCYLHVSRRHLPVH